MEMGPLLSLPAHYRFTRRAPNCGRDEGRPATFQAADSAKYSSAANSSH